MNYRLPLRIALRYLVSRKSHTAVNIISAISVAAVAVTAMAMVCVLSVFNGFAGLVGDKLSRLDPQIKVVAAEGVIENSDSLVDVLRRIEGVTLATPTLESRALAIYDGRQMPVVVKGVAPDYERLTAIDSLIKDDGEFLLSLDGDDLSVVSLGVSLVLNTAPGYFAPLEIYAPRRRGAINPANPMTSFRRCRTFVAGTFEVQQQEYDNDYIFLSLDAARQLFDYPTQATAIELGVKGDVESIRGRISDTLGDKYVAKDRLMQHSQSFKMINVEKWMTFLLLGFILVIASFNIISTLAIIIAEKDESITALRAMGADRRLVSSIFVAEGWLISIVGAAIGVVVGLGLCALQIKYGLVKMGTDAKNLIIDTYPVVIEPTDLLTILGIVAVVGLITSWATAIAMRRRLDR
ncbi:MAG: FtsX-like permease family protein [Bacteroidales bacterium]|nr:FtsX-like permease family protein [Bacteroidales bacterium]